MVIFYFFMLMMIVTAILIVAIPFIKNKSLFSKAFYTIFSFIIIFSFSVYSVLGSQHDLKIWLEKGRTHYALLEQVNQLGGIEGMIARIEAKLKENPDDAEGWFILGKLYLAKNEREKADIAFKNARHPHTAS